MGRRLTTGNFETRAELVEQIDSLYKNTRMSVAAIARRVGITPGTAGRILDEEAGRGQRREWTPEKVVNVAERELTAEEMEAIDRMTENARDVLGTCGHGWMPETCRVHLDPRILNDVFANEDAGRGRCERI